MCTTLYVKSIPVKTRLPLSAWVVFGVVTLFSLASTLVQGSHSEHVAPHSAPAVMTAAAH